jgi:hypothetical protein
MPFEISLPKRLDVYALRYAGLEPDAYFRRSEAAITDNAEGPFEVRLPYFLGDALPEVSVTLLEIGKVVRLRVAAPDPATERAIRKRMARYSVENGGEAVLDREHKAVWKQINAILKREGMTADDVDAGDALLNRRAIESLIALGRQVDPAHLNNLTDLLANGHVQRADREMAVRWLIGLFKEMRDPFERAQLSLRIEENTVPAIAEDLVSLVRDRTFGGSRAALLLALAKSKHPDAANVIASVLDEEDLAWAGVQAVAKLKTTRHADAIRRCLRHRDADVRREAKKALIKLGIPVELPPPPAHLVKGRPRIPKELAEWSQNLDMDELGPTLALLARCVSKGFGKDEVAEVGGVVEAMRPEQTRTFCFPVGSGKKSGELWVSVFMDDVDSPDLAVHADGGVISRFRSVLSAT